MRWTRDNNVVSYIGVAYLVLGCRLFCILYLIGAVFLIDIARGRYLMRIEKVDESIYVFDDFLTEAEESEINIQLKGEVWRYNWPNYEALPLSDPAGTFL